MAKLNLDSFASVLTLIPLVMGAVASVEATVHAHGVAKQDAAMTMISQVLPLIETVVGKDVISDDKVKAALKAVIDAVVSLQNVVQDAKDKARPAIV